MQDHVTLSPLLSGLPGLKHGFLANHTAGGRDALDALQPTIATVNQVHGDRLLWTEQNEKRARDADGLATLVPGLPVGVYSADCTPVLTAAYAKGKPIAVMAVHAGWRGTAQCIAEKSFTEFAAQALRQGADTFYAAIGPCISFTSFEVGEEVVAAFPGALERGQAKLLRLDGDKKKFLFDLPGENTRQLKKAAAQSGVNLEVETLARCTLALKDIYPSYRRDGRSAGRILSYLSFDRG